MRQRWIGLAAAVLVVLAIAGAVRMPSTVLARFQAGTPVAATETPAAAATPAAGAATPAAVAQTVTLVTWYQQEPNGGPLQLGPIRTNDNAVAGPGEPSDRAITGTAEFEDAKNDDLPRIRLGDSIFDAYPLESDDPSTAFRWLYFNDEDGTRPATLVLQIDAVKGPYDGYSGTATFISRASGEGGVLVIVLNPPS